MPAAAALDSSFPGGVPPPPGGDPADSIMEKIPVVFTESAVVREDGDSMVVAIPPPAVVIRELDVLDEDAAVVVECVAAVEAIPGTD